MQLGIEWKPKSSLKSQYKNMQPGLQTYKCYTYFRVQLSRCLRFEGMSVNGSYGEDKAQICSLGLHFFPSGLRLKRHHRTMELNGYQPQRLFFKTFFPSFFTHWNTRKFHMSVLLAKKFQGSDREREIP